MSLMAHIALIFFFLFYLCTFTFLLEVFPWVEGIFKVDCFSSSQDEHTELLMY